MNLMELMKRKIGPAPVWVYFLVLVFGVVWFIRSRQSKTDTGSTSDQSSANSQSFPDAQPMNYSQDIFINLPWNQNNSGATTTPAPVPVPRRRVEIPPGPIVRRKLPIGDGIGEFDVPLRRTSVTSVASQGDYLYSVANTALKSALPFDTSTMRVVSRGDASSETARLMASQRRVVPA